MIHFTARAITAFTLATLHLVGGLLFGILPLVLLMAWKGFRWTWKATMWTIGAAIAGVAFLVRSL